MLHKLLIGILILIGNLLMGCSQEGSTDIAVLRVPVTIEEIVRGDIASFISQTGTIMPIEEMDIVAEVGGEIYFERYSNRILRKGDRLKEGQIIAKLTNVEYLLNISVEDKEMALEHAERDFNDKKKLGELGGSTQREVENAERALLNAENAYKTALLNLEKLNIKSPMTGILTELNSFVEGQKIANGSQIGKVMRYDRVKCQINVTADDFEKTWLEQEAIVTNIVQDKERYIGRVTKISPTIDPTTRTFQLEIEVDNQDLILKPGSFVKVDIVVERRHNVVKIPKHVIVNRRGRDVVYVVENQVANMKSVIIGLQDTEFAEIIEGLNEGDLLVTRGFETLRGNTKVRISR